MKKKSRNLSVYKYFEQLQFEYIVAELRRKIYPAKKDKSYYEKVMKYKKEKIEDIALRNSLPSIFSCSKTCQNYYQLIYKTEGIPNFFYKDKEEQEELQQKDYMFYYAVNSEVKFLTDSKVIVGVIKSVDFKDQTAVVEDYDKKIYVKKLNQITRIL